MDRQVDVVEEDGVGVTCVAGTGQAFHAQGSSPTLCWCWRVNRSSSDRPTIIRMMSFSVTSSMFPYRPGGHPRTVTRLQIAALPQVVRDEDDADALRLQVTHDLQQLIHLMLAERGSRSSIIISCDSMDSARAISTICCSATLSVRTNRIGSSSIQAAHHLAGLAAHLAPVHEITGTRFAADQDVFGDGQAGDQVKLLVDGHNAQALRLLGWRP